MIGPEGQCQIADQAFQTSGKLPKLMKVGAMAAGDALRDGLPACRNRGLTMRAVLMAMLAAGAIGLIGSSETLAAPVNGAALIAAAQALSSVQDARVIVVYKCKINGRWRKGRCPGSDANVNCVHSRTERFRHSGHCRTPQ